MFISHFKQIVEETLKHKINLSPVHLFSYLQWRSHTNKKCLDHFSLKKRGKSQKRKYPTNAQKLIF